MFGIGLPECLLILLMVILFLGARRIPEMRRSLGDAMREVRKKDREK